MKKILYLTFLAAALGVSFFIVKPFWNKDPRVETSSQHTVEKEQYPIHSLSAEELAYMSAAVEELAASTTYSRIPGWKKPSSSEPGVPILITPSSQYSPDLHIYNFNSASSNTVKLVERGIMYGQSVDLRHGQIAPLESPDFLYTAYLDVHNSLQLLSNGTLYKEPVYRGGKEKIAAPLAWSPDSKKLLFLTSVYRGDGEAGAIYDPEYYKILDIENGSLISFPADRALSVGLFLDNNHSIVSMWSENVEKDIVSAINLATFKLDHETYQQKYGFANAVIQSDNRYANPWGGFARYGTRFAYTVSIAGDKEYEHPTPGMVPGPSVAMVIYGDSQSKTTKILAKGSWAQYQQSLISPNGDKVIYEEEDHSASFPKLFFWLYDSATDRQRSYTYEYVNHLEKWLDNDRVLVGLYNSTSSPSTYAVFNTVTGQMIDEFEKDRLIPELVEVPVKTVEQP